ncbi:MAG: ABC transporter permease [Microbacterium sp.]
MTARTTTVLSWGGLRRRMLRTRPGGPVLVAVLCLVLAAIAAGVPIALSALGDATVRAAADSLAPGARDLEANAAGFPQSGAGDADLPDETAAVWGAFDARLADLRSDIGDPLEALLDEAQYVARTEPMFEVEGGDELNLVGFAVDPRYRERATLVDGDWPAPPLSLGGAQGPQVEPIEIALSARSAEELEWPVGEVRGAATATPMRLAGTFDQADGSEDYWYHVPSVLVPRMWIDDAGRHVNATAFLDPQALELLQGWQGATAVWYPLHADDMSAADATEVARQLRVFTANAHTVGSQGAGLGGVLALTFRTTTTATIDAALATTRAMSAVVAITASAPAGVAVAVLALACRIVARDRRSALALLTARGASPPAVRGALAMHGVVFGLIPALLGAALVMVSALVVGGIPPTMTSLFGPLVVAVLPVAILWFTPPPPAGLRDEADGDAIPSAGLRRRRLALELVVVVLALLATGALVSGVLSGARVGSAGVRAAAAGADLLVAAVPLLWGLVGCVVALRLYPLPLRAVFARQSQGPRLVGFLGAARSLREPAAGVAPVLALVIGMSAAVSSGVMLGSIQHGIDTTARVEVGADLQVARADLSGETLDRIRALDGVEAAAGIASVPSGYLRAGRDLVVVTMLFADPDELRAAQDPEHPLMPAGVDLAARGATAPLVASDRVDDASDGATDVTLEGAPARIEGVGEASAPEGIGPNWVLVDAARADRLIPRRTAAVTSALVALEPGADAAAVESAIRELVGDEAVVTTPSARAAELSSGTGAFAIRAALIASTLGVAVLGALAIMLTLALGSRARDRIIALLRVLGAPPRSGRALVAWELLSGVAAALVVGTAVGLALPALLLWAVDLSAFTGAASPAYHLDPLLLAGAIVAFVAVAAVSTLIALALSRRVRAAALLRTSQEG